MTQSETKYSSSHSFDIHLAKEYGIECAIIIAHLQYWINHNAALGRNFIDGKTWTYQTREEIAAHFCYLSPDKVRRATDKLVDEGVLIKRNYNKFKMDKTIWYAFVNEGMFTIGKNAKSIEDSANRNGDIAKAIPHAIPDAIPDNTNTPPNPQKRERAKARECEVKVSQSGEVKKQYGADKLVWLSEQEFCKLALEWGLPMLEGLIEELNDYIGSKGKDTYASHLHTLRGWHRKRQQADKPIHQKVPTSRKVGDEPIRAKNKIIVGGSNE